MRKEGPQSQSGFTIVELIVALSLSMIVMSAVLSGFLFIGRNFARLANQQSLEVAARNTQAYLAQDIRRATSLSSPSATEFTLSIPTAAAAVSVRYVYDPSSKTISRIASPGGSQILQRDIIDAYFRYYDVRGIPYDNGSAPFTTYTNYRSGIKQVSLQFTAQTGDADSGTRTPVSQFASPRLLLRNKDLIE